MALKKSTGTGVELAPSPVHTTDAGNTIDRQINHLRQRIANRAFELCAQRGWTHGQDLEDWFRAESEISASTPIEIVENDDEYFVRADVPGFTEKDLDIYTEPYRLLIRGNTQKQRTSNRDERVLYNEREATQICRVVNFPQEINPEECQAQVHDGILELRLPKSQASKPTRVQVKAA